MSNNGDTPPKCHDNVLNEHARLIARREAEKVILQHLTLCPFAQLNIEERLRTMENRFAILCGAMIGSGLIGGATASMISRLIP
jgi:hypothetical protein